MERKQNIEEIFENAKEPHPNYFVIMQHMDELQSITQKQMAKFLTPGHKTRQNDGRRMALV